MKPVRNMRELSLVKKNLEYQELLYEKELTESTAGMVNTFGDKLKDFAFEFGTKLVLTLFKRNRKPED